MNEAQWEYVGPGDIHDATIESVEETENTLVVSLRTYDGGQIVLRFLGVQEVRRNRPVGMMLYSLCRQVSESAPFFYSLTNWDEDGDAFLDIIADDFEVECED